VGRSRADAALDDVQTDVDLLADVLTAGAARPEVAAIIRPDLPAILRATLAGARVPGPLGASDRASVVKMAGLPMAGPKDDGTASKARLASIADRLERATGMQARLVESALAADHGHADGTGDGSDASEAAESLRFVE
jgi:hypothetical protein